MQLKPVEEQVVALMGASSGIGREAALRFAERGAKVVVSARSEPGLHSLVDEIRRKGGEATVVVADTSEYEQVKAVANRATEEYGRFDTWVHLAAVGLFATFEQTTHEVHGYDALELLRGGLLEGGEEPHRGEVHPAIEPAVLLHSPVGDRFHLPELRGVSGDGDSLAALIP